MRRVNIGKKIFFFFCLKKNATFGQDGVTGTRFTHLTEKIKGAAKMREAAVTETPALRQDPQDGNMSPHVKKE